MRVLLFGASGYLGNEIRRQALAAGHEVIGTCFQSTATGLVAVDIRDRAAVVDVVDQARPDVVVNAAYDKEDWTATAVSPGYLADACNTVGSRYIHVSSDAVFAGDLELYDEACLPSPVSTYGAAKAAAEVVVAASCPSAVIVRTSWILGDGMSAFEGFVRALATKQTRGVLFDDDVRCPVHVSDLAAAVLELSQLTADTCFTGVLHAAGADAMSRYELGCVLAQRDGLDPGVLPKASKASAGAKASSVRLDSTKVLGVLRATRLRGAREFISSAT